MEKWYVLQVFAHSEQNIQKRIYQLQEEGVLKNIKQVVVPTEEVISISPKGKKTILTKAIYSGYVYLQIDEYKPETFAHLRQIPKVLRFIGHKETPSIMSKKEINKILDLKENKQHESPRYKTTYENGEHVLITSGVFENFKGYVKEFYPEENKIIIDILIFGRSTPTEFKIDEITKDFE